MFSRREKEIIYLIAKGLSSKAVANRLFVSHETIKTHRKNMLRKIREANKTESLLEFCIEYVDRRRNPPEMGMLIFLAAALHFTNYLQLF
jgi:DNA-binding CsgD family transcriptional regulator